jgi:RNA polymerase sigma-70 factor (ECF subfamily)
MIVEINTSKNISDREALQNKSLFQLIFQRYAGSLYKTATHYVNRDDAKDIVQDLMIETWNKRDSLTGNAAGSIKNYLFIRLKFRILDFYSKRPEHILWEEALPELVQLSMNEEYDTTILKELEQIIADSMQEMKPSELEVFRLRWEQQLSVQDTAHTLGISSKSVINRFSSAIKTVRENVIEYYNDEPLAEYQLTLLILIFSRVLL